MRYLAIAMVGLGLVAPQTGAAGGYLALIGPAPLRFQKPAPVASLVLPPLLMHDPVLPPPEVDPVPAAAKPPEPPLGPPAPVLPTVLAAPQTNAVIVIVPPATVLPTPAFDTNAPPILTPQMLMHFFNHTNRAPSIVMPVEFNPGRPPAAPSSTSTYILSPPRKP